jgi:hypothetical protein
MTLKEKFIDAFKSGKRFDIQNAETITDEFAIEFAEWMLIKFITSLETGIDAESDNPKEMLEIFKKEKGL